MNENLVLWKPGKQFAGQAYNIDIVLEDCDGLKLYMSNIEISEPNNHFIVSYEDCEVCAYRTVIDSFWAEELPKYVYKFGEEFIYKNTFFEIPESEYKIEISKGGWYEKFTPDHMLHLMIIAYNCIFEIVSMGIPKILPWDKE